MDFLPPSLDLESNPPDVMGSILGDAIRYGITKMIEDEEQRSDEIFPLELGISLQRHLDVEPVEPTIEELLRYE